MEGSIITNALANIPSAISTTLEIITGNELMLFFVGVGIAGSMFGVFRKAKKASK